MSKIKLNKIDENDLHFATIGAFPFVLLLLLAVIISAMSLELIQIVKLKLTFGTALGRCEIVHRTMLNIQFLNRKCL